MTGNKHHSKGDVLELARELVRQSVYRQNEDFAKAAAMLRAYAEVVEGWRPIESAPTDREMRILMLLPSDRVVTGRASYSVIMGPEKPGGGRETIGERFSGYNEEEGSALMPRRPTHWQPLPSPPLTAALSTRGG